MLSVEFDHVALTRKIDNLDRVIQESLRPAAQAAGQVFYDEVKARALSVGGSRRLQAAVYQKYVTESIPGTATYKISWRKQGGKNTKGGLPYTTIGYWIEYGHVQRYAAYKNKNGEWRTAIRPEKRGTPPPKRSAGQAAMDAYFVPRPGGPVHLMPKSFLRSSFTAVQAKAMQAAKIKMQDEIKKAL